MIQLKRRAKAFFIACLGLFYDVRFTRKGNVYLKLRDKKAERKVVKRIVKHLRAK